jgi:hypothetical protein
MGFDVNSSSGIENDVIGSFKSKKELKKSENSAEQVEELQSKKLESTGKCITDVNSVDPLLSKCTGIRPGMFDDFFGVDNDVAQAKKLVKGIVTANTRAEFAEKVGDFYQLVNKMDKHELVQTAEYIGEQMKNTDGKDDIYGSLLMGVLGELKSRETSKPHFIIDEFPMHKFPTEPPVFPPGIEDVFKQPVLKF